MPTGEARQLAPLPKGMDNRAAEHTLPEGCARNIVNADVDNMGRLRRRRGFRKVYSGLGLRDGYACPAGVFFVEGGNIRQWLGGDEARTLGGGVSGRMAWHWAADGVLYMSDGDRSWRFADGALTEPPDPSVPITAVTPETAALKGVTARPPGRIIRDYNGRLYVADDKGVAWYSEPFAYEHFRRYRGFLQFAAPLTLMEPVAGGIWFATEHATWFYAGDPDEGFQVAKSLDHGAIFGTSVRLPGGARAMWQSPRGAIVGGPGGEAVNTQEEHVVPDAAKEGAALYRDRDGRRQYIAALRNPSMGTGAISSWITAEVTRRNQP